VLFGFLRERLFFHFLKFFKVINAAFSDFATFIAWVVLEQEFVELRNNFFLRAENLP
jgi:hypothetical protein